MSNCSDSQPVFRRLVSDGIAVVALTGMQLKAIHHFISRIDSSEYVEIPHPCLCGSTADVTVACKDRYGIPLRTVLCKSCGLMRSDPYLSPEALRKFYQEDYRSIYEETTSSSSTIPLARMIMRGEHIYQFFQDHDVAIPKHVFEVGCGTGGNLVCFLIHGHIVGGCDYGVDFLEMGRKLGLDLREGGIETLGDELSPSLVILCHVLEHFCDPVLDLGILRKKLPQGSLVYIELPGIFSIRQSYGNLLPFLQNAHVYHFCLQTLDYVMSFVGFERVYGNERIQAIYRLNPLLRAMNPDPLLYRHVMSYLKRIDRLRWFPPPWYPFQQIAWQTRRLMGSHFYEWARMAIKKLMR